MNQADQKTVVEKFFSVFEKQSLLLTKDAYLWLKNTVILWNIFTI